MFNTSKSIKALLGSVFFLSALFLASCSDDKDSSDPDPVETAKKTYNFWARIGDYPNSSTFIVQVPSLDTGSLNYVGKGIEVDGTLNYGLILKDGFYYETVGTGKFGKYHVENDKLITDKEVPFTQFGVTYAHTWIGDKLYLFGTSGTGDKMFYAIVETGTMVITTGSVALPAIPTGFDKYIVGFAQARSDGKIFLGFTNALVADYTVRQKQVNVAVLNSSTMAIESVIVDTRTGNGSGMTNLFQTTAFIDANNDIYFNVGPESSYYGTADQSMVFRIKSGATDTDKTFKAGADVPKFMNGLWNLGNNKAIVRFYDPALAANSTYAYTHGVLDLATQTVTMLAIPACKAGSVQSVSIEDGKAHIITNHEGNTDGYVYIYDIPTGAVTKGMRVPSGYSYLLRIDKL